MAWQGVNEGADVVECGGTVCSAARVCWAIYRRDTTSVKCAPP